MAKMGLILQSVILLTSVSLILSNEICGNDETCNLIGQFEFDLEVEGNMIELAWKFNQSELIFGFQAIIYKNSDEIIYQSPILHRSERYMNIEKELNGKNKICVKVFKNSTDTLGEKCEVIEIKDLKIVIGILAGVIFLIPCIMGISYVIYKDYRNKSIDYEKLDQLYDQQEQHTDNVAESDTKKKARGKTECAENLAFVAEDVPISCNCLRDNRKSHQDNCSLSTKEFNTKNKADMASGNEAAKASIESDITDDIRTLTDNIKATGVIRQQSETDIIVGDLSGTNL